MRGQFLENDRCVPRSSPGSLSSIFDTFETGVRSRALRSASLLFTVAFTALSVATNVHAATGADQESDPVLNWGSEIEKCIGHGHVRVVLSPKLQVSHEQFDDQAADGLVQHVRRLLADSHIADLLSLMGPRETAEWFSERGLLEYELRPDDEKPELEMSINVQSAQEEAGSLSIHYTLSGLTIKKTCQISTVEIQPYSFVEAPKDVRIVLREFIKSIVDKYSKSTSFNVCEVIDKEIPRPCEPALEVQMEQALSESKTSTLKKKIHYRRRRVDDAAKCVGTEEMPAVVATLGQGIGADVLNLHLEARVGDAVLPDHRDAAVINPAPSECNLLDTPRSALAAKEPPSAPAAEPPSAPAAAEPPSAPAAAEPPSALAAKEPPSAPAAEPPSAPTAKEPPPSCKECEEKITELESKLSKLKQDHPLRVRFGEVARNMQATADPGGASKFAAAKAELAKISTELDSLTSAADAALNEASNAQEKARQAGGSDKQLASLAELQKEVEIAQELKNGGDLDAAVEHAKRATMLYETFSKLGVRCPNPSTDLGPTQLIKTGLHNLSVTPRGQNFAEGIRALLNGADMTKVEIKRSFCIADEEVTYGEFQAFLQDAGAKFNDTVDQRIVKATSKNNPVALVRYTEAMDYAQWRSEKDGVKYSLPTAEQVLAAYDHSIASDRNSTPLADSLDGENREWLRSVCPDGRQVVVGSIPGDPTGTLAQCFDQKAQNMTTGFRLVIEQAD
jgi:Sulfatase-modifying factor enzyme 1